MPVQLRVEIHELSREKVLVPAIAFGQERIFAVAQFVLSGQPRRPAGSIESFWRQARDRPVWEVRPPTPTGYSSGSGGLFGLGAEDRAEWPSSDKLMRASNGAARWLCLHPPFEAAKHFGVVARPDEELRAVLEVNLDIRRITLDHLERVMPQSREVVRISTHTIEARLPAAIRHPDVRGDTVRTSPAQERQQATPEGRRTESRG